MHDGMLPFCETTVRNSWSHAVHRVADGRGRCSHTNCQGAYQESAWQQALPPDQRQAVQTMPWQTAATSQEEGMDSVVALEPEAPQSTRPCAAW